MTRRVLALQHVWDDPPGYLGEIMEEHGIAFEVVKLAEGPNLSGLRADLSRYGAIISLGGPQHAAEDEKYPYLVEEKALIRKAVEEDIPYLGLCLGGQLLAHALGAPVIRHTMTEIGFFEVQLTEEGKRDRLFQGLPGSQLVFHWHMDTFGIPAGAVKLAISENTSNQGFRFGHRAYGLQYHIELTPQMLDVWLRYPDYRKEIIKVLGPDTPDAIEGQRSTCYPIYREHTRMLFENFLRMSELAS